MKLSRSLIIALVMAALIVGGYFFYRYYSDTQGILDKDRIKMLEADTQGGPTPQNTMELFIGALESGDMRKASLYFSLDERENWNDALMKVKESGFLDEMIIDIKSKSVPDPESRIETGEFRFLIKIGDATVSEITLELNEYSKVWKIKSI